MQRTEKSKTHKKETGDKDTKASKTNCQRERDIENESETYMRKSDTLKKRMRELPC